ncbi:DeoR/GlpR family DNA-binding transcription regulator [Caldinitratiruptor microaerophilus]|uniref:DeoR family transcriptional regulator n=1 Tax=Caldinitratiruptor microaerophilus TaxID=671077 RepID=A0AA35G7J2_9FIRM|nr:DeoR/GlpR family DNA-binding transcription regulator [Caldinitratiruptor microaerophilus]BDG60156.1 DeoR family transcriptional regulator [Caldinitratiruptor microaerophilus]
MLPAERRDRIVRELRKDRFLSVTELAGRLGASISTIRRDLAELEQEGVIVRTHGGAGLNTAGLPKEMAGSVRALQQVPQKQSIGRATARLLANMSTAILDGGTTTLEVARALNPTRHLRVITDSVEIAWELRDRENVTVILTGGIMRRSAYNLFGSLAEQALAGLHAEVCVMGCSGLSLTEGLTKHDIEALPVRRRMVEVSSRLIVVADSTKLGRVGLVAVCGVDRIHTLVTDSGIPPAFRAALEEQGVEVIIADA